MAVFEKKKTFKDISIDKNFTNEPEQNIKQQSKRGRNKIANKRDKTYTFYCTQDELDELEKLAKEKHLTMAEYFRFKLFN